MKNIMMLPAGHYKVVAEFDRCEPVPVPVVIGPGGITNTPLEANIGVSGSGNPSRNHMICQPGGKKAVRSGAAAEAGQ
jgi:hypothetical protein